LSNVKHFKLTHAPILNACEGM